MKLVLALLVFFSTEAYASLEICSGMICGGMKTFGMKHDYYCQVTDDNLLLPLPPGVATNAQHCELLAIEFSSSIWYNYRRDGTCELLAYCGIPAPEEGSVTGPDPGKGQTCFPESTTSQPSSTALSTTTQPSTTTQLTTTKLPTTTELPTTTYLPTTTEPPVTTPPPTEVMLVIGGLGDGHTLGTVDVITEDLQVISGSVPDAPVDDYMWQAALIDDQVVVCGGTLNKEVCQHLNTTTRSWQPSSQLQQQRSLVAPVINDDMLYVFGGWGPGGLSSVERYDSAMNSWSLVPQWAMPEQNRMFCAVKHGDFIYHVGGSVLNGRTVRRLNTITNTYEFMPYMKHARFRHACVLTTINGQEGILVTGGLDPPTSLSSTEFYFFERQIWQSLADMNLARDFHGIGIFKGQPVVFGGERVDGDGFYDSMEVYNEIDDKWTIVEGSTLTEARTQFAYVKVPWSEI